MYTVHICINLYNIQLCIVKSFSTYTFYWDRAGVLQPRPPCVLIWASEDDLLPRIGVNGFENPMRDSKVTEFKSQVYIYSNPLRVHLYMKCIFTYIYWDIVILITVIIITITITITITIIITNTIIMIIMKNIIIIIFRLAPDVSWRWTILGTFWSSGYQWNSSIYDDDNNHDVEDDDDESHCDDDSDYDD